MSAEPITIFQDREYQLEGVESIWNYFRKNATGNPLVAMPPGTGKSVVIARFLESVLTQFGQQRILILTHVKELIAQNFEKLKSLWHFAPAGIYSAGLGQRNMSQPITFAGIASVARKWAAFGHIDLILIDECHLMSPNDTTMYRKFIAGLLSINPLLRVIGFTATPWRMGHGHLTDPYEDSKGNILDPLFTEMCFDITDRDSFNRLFDEGFLVPVVPKRPKLELETDGLHKRGGEFIEKEMQDRFDREEITEVALREAMEYGADRKHWLVFASGTDHADNVCEMLNLFGIPAGCVHSKRAGRDQTIADFKAGKIRALVNNNVLTTGFDYPNIDFLVILRATGSTILWVQILGRGIRPVYGLDGKGLLANGAVADLNSLEGRLQAIADSGKHDCLVMDFARNTQSLGPINDPVVPRAKGKGSGTAPVKICDSCETYNHTTARYCGGQPFKTSLGCGSEFTFEVKFKTEAATDELIKISEPVVKVFKVDVVTIDRHTKDGSPPMMKVTYYCGYKHFTDFVCVQHTNFAGRKARKWWEERSDTPMPSTTDEAIALAATALASPTHLRVWTNKKYPEIMSYCYDGSSFGTQEEKDVPPPIENRVQLAGQFAGVNNDDDWDDDVPF